MANTIRIRRSSVPGRIPSAANLNLGELAINTFDGKLFLKQQQGAAENVIEIGGSTGGTPGTLVPILETRQVLMQDITLAAGYNGFSVGPVTVDATYVITVPENATWAVF